MVRYHEIIKEADYFDIVGKKRKELLTQLSYSYSYGESYKISLSGNTVSVIDNNLTVKEWTEELPNIKILEVQGRFIVKNTRLKNLLNAPLKVNQQVEIIGNSLLTSLEGLPKKLEKFKALIVIDNKNLLSLKGIDKNSDIYSIWIQYMPNLPLLRLMYIKDNISIVDEEGNERYEDLQNILNDHIKNYQDIDERILRCKIALAHAGYESNARLD